MGFWEINDLPVIDVAHTLIEKLITDTTAGGGGWTVEARKDYNSGVQEDYQLCNNAAFALLSEAQKRATIGWWVKSTGVSGQDNIRFEIRIDTWGASPSDYLSATTYTNGRWGIAYKPSVLTEAIGDWLIVGVDNSYNLGYCQFFKARKNNTSGKVRLRININKNRLVGIVMSDYPDSYSTPLYMGLMERLGGDGSAGYASDPWAVVYAGARDNVSGSAAFESSTARHPCLFPVAVKNSYGVDYNGIVISSVQYSGCEQTVSYPVFAMADAHAGKIINSYSVHMNKVYFAPMYLSDYNRSGWAAEASGGLRGKLSGVLISLGQVSELRNDDEVIVTVGGVDKIYRAFKFSTDTSPNQNSLFYGYSIHNAMNSDNAAARRTVLIYVRDV